jgi:hypothetical protein
MRIQHGVATTIEDQIDALETAWHELMRISLSSGFNWHHIPECEEIFSFDEWTDYNSKLLKIWHKLEEIKKQQDESKKQKSK